MTSPITPQVCKNTGRVLTEWFEIPEYDDADLEELACAAFGVTPATRPKPSLVYKPEKGEEEAFHLSRMINNFIVHRKTRKWKHAMSQQEVQVRMDAATKMVDKDNFKFLNDSVRERTGLEVNPLWMMECLVRSGILSPKEQLNALGQLATFTHSKAPSITHATNTNMKPEDWLIELAKEHYETVDDAEVIQPRQRNEYGSTPKAVKESKRRVRDVQALENLGSIKLLEMEALFDDDEDE